MGDWERLEAIFAEAVLLYGDARDAYLRRACGDDDALRRRVDALLGHADTTGSFIRQAFDADDLSFPRAALPEAGQHIGSYELVRELGHGGMGEVWLAQQHEPVQRQVALKLIRPGMDTRQVVARFKAERQALAMMDHPALAQVHDGGTTTEGRPYFVMEYVDGLPITAYCARERLGLRPRLELFIQVCAGVHHAHQKAILHRDLKPSNVLVKSRASRPVPKIIDFGIAKVLDRPLTEETLRTEAGSVIGTPGYMSPEQVRGNDVDIRADVYSLGALLYELLTGVPPLEIDRAHAESLEEIRRRILQEEPLRPSVRSEDSRATGASAEGLDAAEPRRLRGELDWITMKALEKDRVRRYGSVAELAADVQRYLALEPVLAGPPSATYRLRKFARRHKVGVTLAATSALVVVGFAAVMSVMVVRVSRERDRADAAAEKARAINEFLQTTLSAPNPVKGSGRDTTVLQALDAGVAEADKAFADEPATHAAILETIGDTYRKLGQLDRSRPLLQQALDLYRSAYAGDHDDIASALEALAYVDEYLDDRELALDRLNEALAMRRRLHGDIHPTVAAALNSLGKTLRKAGKYKESEAVLTEALDIQRATRGPETKSMAFTLDLLASTRYSLGNLESSVQLHRESLAIRRKIFGDKHPDISDSLNNLAHTLQALGRYDESREMYLEVLELDRELLGPEHHYVGATLNNIALLYHDMGNEEEAERFGREALALRSKIFDEPHTEIAQSLANLGIILHGQERFDEAERLERQALAMRLEVLGHDHPTTGLNLIDLASLLRDRGRYDEAESRAREGLAIFEAQLDAGHPKISGAQVALGGILCDTGRFDEGEEWLEHGRAGFAEAIGESSKPVGQATVELGLCELARGGVLNAEKLLHEGVDIVGEESRSGRKAIAALERAASE